MTADDFIGVAVTEHIFIFNFSEAFFHFIINKGISVKISPAADACLHRGGYVFRSTVYEYSGVPDVIILCVVNYAVGDYYYITRLNIINLVIYDVGAVALEQEIYLIKRMIMRPGGACFGNSFAYSPMIIKAFVRVKFDVTHTLHLLSFPIIASHIKKVKKCAEKRQNN